MTERIEQGGHPCELPEGDLVGYCGACQYEIFSKEIAECDCGKKVHKGDAGPLSLKCVVSCKHCDYEGCKGCLTKYDEGYFCPEDCRVEYLAERAKTTGNRTDLQAYMEARKE